MLPCNTRPNRCPYYRFAEDGVYGLLPSVNSTDTEYWGALSGATLTSCNASFLAAATAKVGRTACLGSRKPPAGRALRARIGQGRSTQPATQRRRAPPHQARRLASQLPALASLAGSTVCSATGAANGKYLQATSQFPGKGPCYPVWAATAPYFNRRAGAQWGGRRARSTDAVGCWLRGSCCLALTARS